MADEPNILRMYESTYGPFVHMAPNDKAIWVKWLSLGGGIWAPFEYDVRVGNGVALPAGSSKFITQQAYFLTTKRIDVLATIHGAVTVIEVKQRAGLGAIGQLIGYRQLLLATRPEITSANMLLVTDDLQPDMLSLLTENGIQVDVVGY